MIGIVGGSEKQMGVILEGMKVTRKAAFGVSKFYFGKIGKSPVVICVSGLGKVAAATACQVMIEKFKVRKVVFIGVAGALNPDLDIGDFVVSKDCMQHDVDMSALGLKPGQFLYAKQAIYPADKKLANKALAALKAAGFRATIGRVLSGDQFVSDRGKSEQLRKDLGGDCIEMEGAAAAYVCTAGKVPFVVLREISDRADHAAKIDWEFFSKKAAQDAYDVIIGLVSGM
jgi:adenosylhomocysteine nucleosidase